MFNKASWWFWLCSSWLREVKRFPLNHICLKSGAEIKNIYIYIYIYIWSYWLQSLWYVCVYAFMHCMRCWNSQQPLGVPFHDSLKLFVLKTDCTLESAEVLFFPFLFWLATVACGILVANQRSPSAPCLWITESWPPGKFLELFKNCINVWSSPRPLNPGFPEASVLLQTPQVILTPSEDWNPQPRST